MPMYYFVFHAVPTDKAQHPDVLGAYVSCWIQDSSIEQAELTARHGIESDGFGITGHDIEPFQATRADFVDHGGLEYYDQALIDREVWVFHQYSSDEEE